MLSKLKTGLRALLRRSEMERELDEELRHHIEQQIEQNIRLGMNLEEARSAARKAFCGVEQAKERSRDARGVRWLEDLWQDLGYGGRVLMKTPGFTLIAAITLALGIGANTAIFSVVNGVLLRQLPYEKPERLALIWEKFSSWRLEQVPISASEFADYRNQTQSFSSLAAFDTADFNLTGGDLPERAPGAEVSASLFPLLGVKPQLGRAFSTEENEPGHDDVVLLSHGLWRRGFGADPGIIGRILALNGRSYKVIGVMPPSFQFPMSLFGIKGVTFTQPAELWTPVTFSADSLKERASRSLCVIGRLKPGVTLAQAGAEMNTIAYRMRQQYPKNYPPEGWGAYPVSLHEQIVGRMRLPLLVLMGAVSLVLLIACANVASLLLARSTVRRKEIAVRAALGASSRRITRQLITESLLLAFCGGGLGALIALWGTDQLVSLSAQTLPRMKEVGIDGRVLGFTLAISMLTGLVFGLMPVIEASKLDLNEVLKEGGRLGAVSAGQKRLRSLIVVAEFALALVLLIGAGLLSRSFWRLQNVSPGFEPENALTFQLTLPWASYPGSRQVAAFFQQAVARISHLPGVKAAGAASILPLSGSNNDQGFVIEGRMLRDLKDVGDEEFRVVTPDYFRAMGIPLLKGRFFNDADNADIAGVTIINQAFAKRHFRGEEPLGKRLTMDDPREPNAKWLTIVGVVGDVRHGGLNVEEKPEFYVPHLQYARLSMILVARIAADPANLSAAIRREILALDPQLPLYNVRPMERIIDESVAPQRLSTLIFGGFAALALMLAAIGIYGVMSYAVAQRTNEIGIRIALGAQTRDVLKLVVTQGMKPALAGIAIGLAAALGLTRLMKNLLFDVSATDPLTFAAITLLIAAVGLLACWIPARRATKVDPLQALRHD
ncbi:MAG: ABC transporter permease [Blastocatellia bacterium]|nr:ABC transporter permease [Blastocatellia bacterium]